MQLGSRGPVEVITLKYCGSPDSSGAGGKIILSLVKGFRRCRFWVLLKPTVSSQPSDEPQNHRKFNSGRNR